MERTPSPEKAATIPARPNRRPNPFRRRSAFTLSEVMISASLSLLLVAAMLTAFFHLTKTGIAMGNYHDLERETRNVLQYFARDVHQAEDALWIDANTLRLTVEGEPITYLYNPANKTFLRRLPGENDSVLASGINALSFQPFDITGNQLSLASHPANASAATKMIQLTVDLGRQAGTSETSASIITSRYMLRNKRVE